MRFLFLAPTVDLSGGTGDATHVGEEVRGLSGLGNQVLLIAGRGGDATTPPAGVEIHAAGYRRTFDFAGDVVRYIVSTLRTFILACYLARKFRPEIIFERHAFIDIGPLIARITNVRSISELNGLVANESGELYPRRRRQSGIVSRLESFSLSGHAGFVCVTDQLARFASGLTSANPSRILVAGNGVDVNRFTPGVVQPSQLNLPEGHYIVFTGELAAWQGLHWLLSSMEFVVKEEPLTRLLIIGDGPELDTLVRIVHERRLNQNVLFLGRIPHAKVPEYLQVARVCVAPKNPGRVTSPIKVFEYLASGKPIVVTDTVELADLIESEGLGEVVKYGDTKGLSVALLKFLQQPDISAKVGLRGRKWVESNRSWDRVALDVSEFVRGLVASRFLP